MKGRGFIDYPFTEFKSDLMDLYLIKNCKFFLGPISGIYDVAAMFQIASLMPNSIPNPYSYPLKKEDIFIYKHVYDKISNNFVSVVGLNDFFKSRSFSDKSIEFFENTEEEIYELVKEFFSRESGNIKYSDFQLKWISEIKNTIIRDEINEIELKVSVAQKYRHLSKLLGANGVIGKRFIQENYSTSSLGKRK
jgi:putative glycosyltransferase (TIGR04372 family)